MLNNSSKIYLEGRIFIKKTQKIAVIVKQKKTADFLKSFFANNKIYRPLYFSKAEPFRAFIEKNKPTAVITEESFLPSISDKTTRLPVIVIISGKVAAGVETAISHHADCFVSPPYLVKDLAYKLERIIIDRTELDSMKRELWEYSIINDLFQMISSTLDPKEVLYRIVRKIADVMPVSRCSIIRVDWLRKSAYVIASHENPEIINIKLNLKKYPEILAALSSKEPVLISNILMDPLMRKVREIIAPLGIRSILVIPIMFHEKVIGTLFLRTSRTEHTFEKAELRLLNAIANASANFLNNAFLHEQVEDEKTRLEHLAITDYLTGLYNVRYFYHCIIKEFTRSERYVLPIGCMLLDIDHFKKINDVHGHRVGDRVLKEFARQLSKHVRKSDVLARYGGEEFIIMLPQTSHRGAQAEAERLRTAIKNYKFKSLNNKKGITISIGVSYCPHPKVKTHDELISLADNALFEAKNSGRDKVIVHQ